MGRPKKTKPEPWELENWAEDYRFLIDQGLRRAEIAKRQGLNRETLESRCKELGIWHLEVRYRAIDEKLQVFIESGKPFSSFDFPFHFESRHVTSVLRMAESHGLVKPVGKCRTVLGSNPSGTTTVYEAA